MPFGIIGWTGPRMRQVVGLEDRSTGRGTFGGAFGARHCIQWELYGVRVRQCPRPTASAGYSPPRRGPFPNYFGQTCFLTLTNKYFVGYHGYLVISFTVTDGVFS